MKGSLLFNVIHMIEAGALANEVLLNFLRDTIVDLVLIYLFIQVLHLGPSEHLINLPGCVCVSQKLR
jgi:hypothetical protein